MGPEKVSCHSNVPSRTCDLPAVLSSARDALAPIARVAAAIAVLNMSLDAMPVMRCGLPVGCEPDPVTVAQRAHKFLSDPSQNDKPRDVRGFSGRGRLSDVVHG